MAANYLGRGPARLATWALLGSLGCGGSSATLPAVDADSGLASTSDAASNLYGDAGQSTLLDANVANADGGDEGGTVGDAGASVFSDSASDAPVSIVCAAPFFDDGGSSCETALCPAQTACVAYLGHLLALYACAPIPAACGGQPTCACMGATALTCFAQPPPGSECNDFGSYIAFIDAAP